MDKLAVPSVVDLGVARERLMAPTLLMTHLAAQVGAFAHIVHPGQVEVVMVEGDVLSIRLRVLNPYEREAEAYRIAGRPIPQRVIDDQQAWRRAHGR